MSPIFCKVNHFKAQADCLASIRVVFLPLGMFTSSRHLYCYTIQQQQQQQPSLTPILVGVSYMDLFATLCTKSTSMLRDFKQTEKARKTKTWQQTVDYCSKVLDFSFCKVEHLNQLPNSFFHEKIEQLKMGKTASGCKKPEECCRLQKSKHKILSFRNTLDFVLAQGQKQTN